MNATQKGRKESGLAEKLQSSEETFQSQLKSAQIQSTHSSAQGSEMENLWIKLLGEYLPARYKIGRGFVGDSKGEVSDQIDCIIYDALYTPPLYGGKDNLCVPAESVYAIFESKPSVSKGNVEYASKKAASVRALHREKNAIVVDRGEKQSSPKFVNIIGGLLAVSLSVEEATVKKHFRNSDLDCILVADEKKPSYWDKFDETVSSRAGKGALITGIFRVLCQLQKHGTVPPINWKIYERATHNA